MCASAASAVRASGKSLSCTPNAVVRTGRGRDSTVLTTCAAAGGKYTWGSVMDRDGDVATDPRDPNYDSGDEQNGVSYHLQLSVQIKMYKQSVRPAMQRTAAEPPAALCSSC